MRYLIAVLSLAVLVAGQLPDNAADLPISQLLNLASHALSTGKSQSALSIYDYCLKRDPQDAATLYKRATVRLATGQLARAKEGFHEVLRVKDFEQAHYQLAKLQLKLGEFEAAKDEVDSFLRLVGTQSTPEVNEAKELRKSILRAQKELLAARKALTSKPPRLDTCISSATAAINSASNSEELRLLRAECYMLSHEWDSAVGDLSRATALSTSLPSHLSIRLALLQALFLDNGREVPADALLPLKRCLSSDPDSKPCRKAFKALKALEKELAKLRNWMDGSRYTEAAVVLAGSSRSDGVIQTVRSMLETYSKPDSTTGTTILSTQSNLDSLSPLLNQLLSDLCNAYVHLGSTRKASVACENVLRVNPQDMWGLVGRGDQLLADEKLQEAVNAFSTAFEASGQRDRDILSRLQKAQRLLKQSTAKDYYKVLGVDRNADAKTIKRAYRKATLKAHPDKEGGSEEKMAALNEAYEVLSKPELRERFDNGEDPNDSQAGQGGGHPFFHQGGGHPFAQFFQQGAGAGAGGQFGGQQFSFRFG